MKKERSSTRSFIGIWYRKDDSEGTFDLIDRMLCLETKSLKVQRAREIDYLWIEIFINVTDSYFFFFFLNRYRRGPTLVNQEKRKIVTRERILRFFPSFHATGILRNTGSLAKCGCGRRWSANNHSHRVFPPRISTFPSFSARLSASIYLPIIGVGQRSHMPPLFGMIFRPYT